MLFLIKLSLMPKYDYDLNVSSEDLSELVRISKSRTESFSKIQRAKFILMFMERNSRKDIANHFNVTELTVQKCIKKAKSFGVIAALSDLSRSGRNATITEDAKTWLINAACQKPIDFDYPNELWTNALLAQYARNNCKKYGHESLSRLASGTVSKILNSNSIKPHKIR